MAGTTDATNPFPEWLQDQLARLGWTMAELGRRADTQQSVINRIIGREVNLGPDVARRIADALEIPQVELFSIAKLIDQPISPRTAAERELMAIADELTDEHRDTLIWLARSLRQKQQTAERHEKTNPTFRPAGKGARA